MSRPRVTIRDSGWTIIFIETEDGPSKPIITPDLVPAFPKLHNDKVLAAYVILPESSGDNQYWVPVSERMSLQTDTLDFDENRFAQLQTEEWTVIFLRKPL